MAETELKLDYTFTFNLGRVRHERLFLKSLQESKKRKKKISIGALIRESIDKNGK